MGSQAYKAREYAALGHLAASTARPRNAGCALERAHDLRVRTVAMVSCMLWAMKWVCSRFMDCCISWSFCVSYIFFCFSSRIALCLTAFWERSGASSMGKRAVINEGQQPRAFATSIPILPMPSCQVLPMRHTFPGPSLILAICCLYLSSSSSIFAIFLSIVSALPSVCAEEGGITESVSIMGARQGCARTEMRMPLLMPVGAQEDIPRQ